MAIIMFPIPYIFTETAVQFLVASVTITGAALYANFFSNCLGFTFWRRGTLLILAQKSQLSGGRRA